MEFSLKIDSSDFDKAIQDIQRKVREAYRSQGNVGAQQSTAGRLEGMGMGGVMSKPTMEAYQRSVQTSRREMDQIIKKEAEGQEKLNKFIGARAEKLKVLLEMQKTLVKGEQDELAIAEKIARVKNNLYQQQEIYASRDKTLNQAMDARQGMSRKGVGGLVDAYKEGGMGGLAGNMAGGVTMAGISATIAGLAAVAASTAFIVNQIGGSAFRTQQNTGSAIQGTVGSTMEAMSNPYGQAWASERMNAVKEAQRQDARTRFTDILTAPLHPALAGSGISSFLGNVLNGEAKDNGAFFGAGDWLRHVGTQQMQEYNSQKGIQFAENYEKSIRAQQEENPLKKLAAQTYGDNYQAYLQAQRGMGLNYNSFHGAGGFRDRIEAAGFTDQMGMGMSGDILSAGGSTAMARNSAFGLQLQRAGLTNAGGMLGALSGGMSGANSEQAMIKILAEGTSIGLDSSTYAAENRKFAQSVTEIVARTGARMGGDVSATAEGFGRFVGDKSNQGIDAAKTAYEKYQQISSETTGPRGIMRAAGFMSDPSLSKISMIGKTALMQMPEEDFNEENPVVRNAAREAGLTVAQLRERVHGVNANSQSRFGKTDTDRNVVQSYMKAHNIKQFTENEYNNAQGNEGDTVRKAFDEMASYQAAELGIKGAKNISAFGYGTVNGNPAAMDPATRAAMEADTKAKYTGKDTGRIEDKSIQDMAASSELATKSFREFSSAIVPSVDQIHKFNDAMAGAVESMKKMSGNDRDRMGNALNSILGNKTSQENQAGSGSQ